MPTAPQKLIESQVQCVRRRLFGRKLLQSLVGFWALRLLVCAVWFLIRPLEASTTADWARYGIPAGVLIASTLTAFLWSVIKAPRFAAASLAFDEQFDLKERMTTFTTLSAEQLQSPAGQALLEDVQEKVEKLDVASRFPVGLNWSWSLMPVGTGALALAASFFNPSFSGGHTRLTSKQQAVADPKEIQQQLENLRKVVKKENSGEDLPKSKELEELEKEWDKLVNKPLNPNNKEQVRERTNELARLEEKIQKRVEDLKDKSADLKKHLDKLLLDKLGKKLEDGPAKDLEDALARGKFDKAREVLEKLRKELEKGELGKEEQKKLSEQLAELHDKLKRLTDQQERKDQLQKDFDEGKISKEQLDRELANLKQESQDLQDLDNLAELLGECKECLGAGNSLKAGKALKAALDKLREMELTEAEIKRLLADQKILGEACMGLCEACEGECEGNRNALGRGKRPGGIRPIGEEPDSKITDTREKGQSDPNGQQFITGFSRGGTFKKIPSTEVGGAFKRAEQEAPEAIERQRIPAEAEAQVRGYFQKLGGQK